MLRLSDQERFALSDGAPAGLAMAMRIVTETARVLGARSLVPITSAHVDGCLYHGDSSVHFVERLQRLGARVTVPTSLNVGSLDLLHPDRVRADARYHRMARRVMDAYVAIGCRPSWTCAPYQAGYRPGLGEHVAWAESNAVAFANSVLGARTNRNGDFLDVCCAITARAPNCGLHLDANRSASVQVDVGGLSARLRREPAFYPVLGAWLGSAFGDTVVAVTGIPADLPEDCLKALGAGAASTGAVGLFHAVGVTPEAPDLATAGGGHAPSTVHALDAGSLRAARDALTTAPGERLDCVALGSPHFSADECRALAALLGARKAVVPIHVCTGRGVIAELERVGLRAALEACGASFVVDTCVVVAPILEAGGGVMMTNSAKFAHYGPANTGYEAVFGSLHDCVESAIAGRVVRDERIWQ